MQSYLVSCSKKRGSHSALTTQPYPAHKRIEGLGGIHGGQHWYFSEELILQELQKPELERKSTFYLIIGRRKLFLTLAIHSGRMYLKTQLDDYAPVSLLALPDCPYSGSAAAKLEGRT